MDLDFIPVYVQRFDSIKQDTEQEVWNIQKNIVNKRMFTE